MPSVIQGYEYDIFISYRHNDNRSGWVTEFVNALQEELAATIKEPLTIYFDKNPHDGLLETHNVDKSLEGKLKCLIFIPIISQTYCDPKSFAWQHEFCAFNKLAIEGNPLSIGEGSGVRSFGRDIKLSNGNVASRILPIKIHDLDVEDKSLLESELGGVLRAIEFIYKEAGVNRPLKPTDSKTDNQNKTDYRNQVNKVANAIKEIINAIKNPNQASHTGNRQPVTRNDQNPSRKKAVIISLAVLLIAVICYFVYQQRSTSNLPTGQAGEQPAQLDRSIAVLPFVDMSANKDQEYFSDGISEELLNLLAKIPELKVIARTSSFAFKGKNVDIQTIAEKLGVVQILQGSVRKSGNNLRITAQLINAKDGTQIWSETYNRQIEEIFKMQDEIARAVVSQLTISLSSVPGFKYKSSVNPEVHGLYLQGKYFTNNGNYKEAEDFYLKAIDLDSVNAEVWGELSFTYWALSESDPKAWDKLTLAAEKSIRLDSQLDLGYWTLGLRKVAFEWDWEAGQNYFNKALSLNPNSKAKISKSVMTARFGQYEEAIRLAKECVDYDPVQTVSRRVLLRQLCYLKQFDEAMRQAQKIAELDPTDLPGIANYDITNVYLQQGKFQEAITYIQKIPLESFKLQSQAIAYWGINQKDRSNQALNQLIKKFEHIDPFYVAEVYAFRGERDHALEYLERAYKAHDGNLPRFINNSHWLKSMHDDERYDELLKKLKLPKL